VFGLPPLHGRPLGIMFVIAAAGVWASGCARRASPPVPVTMRIGVGAPPRGVRGSGASGVINALMSETWLTGRPDGRQSERLVSDWSWDKSRTVLHLKLRSDVYFHDGTKLTPEIAAEALRGSVKNARDEAALSFLSITSVSVSGSDGLEVRLSEPNSFVLPDLSLVALRKPGSPNIGTGSFKLARRDGQQAVLTAFQQYYRGHPALNEIDVVPYPTQRNAWAALMRGEVDMLYEVSRDAAEFVNAESTVRTYTFSRPYYIPLVFNVRHPILKKAEVRTAINEALDRATLVHEGLNDRGRPADGPIWPEHWAQPQSRPQFVFDPDAARHRLDSAGLTGTRNGTAGMPSRFSFTCLVFADDSRYERLAVLVQKQLADVGIDMKLVPLKQPELEARLRSGDFDAFLFEMFGRSLSWVYEFWHYHEGALMNTGYRSVDGVLDQIRAARSDDDVRAGVAEFARIIHQDPPAAFLAWQTTTRAVSTKFDVEAEENRDILITAWQWRPATSGKQAAR